MKIIICGSRRYENEFSFNQVLRKDLFEIKKEFQIESKDIEILYGDLIGTDKLTKRFCEKNNSEYKGKKFKTNWQDMSPPLKVGYNTYQGTYNVFSGFKRNKSMIEYGLNDEKQKCIMIVFIFDDDKSIRGLIEQAKKSNIKIIEHDIIKEKILR